MTNEKLMRGVVAMRRLLVLFSVFVMCVGCTKEGTGTEKVIEYVPENMISENSLDVIKNEHTSEMMATTPTQSESEEESIFYKMPEVKINKLLYGDIKVLVDNYNTYYKLCMGNFEEKELVIDIFDERCGNYIRAYKILLEDYDTWEEIENLYDNTFADREYCWYLAENAFFENEGQLYLRELYGFDYTVFYESMFDVVAGDDEVIISFLRNKRGVTEYGFYSCKSFTFKFTDNGVRTEK